MWLFFHLFGLQETRLTEAGQVWAHEVMREKKWYIVCLDGHWRRGVLPAKRDQVASRLLLDQVRVCRKRLSTSAQEKALYESSRCLWKW